MYEASSLAFQGKNYTVSWRGWLTGRKNVELEFKFVVELWFFLSLSVHLKVDVRLWDFFKLWLAADIISFNNNQPQL